ncbi:hypothetical protein MKZ38_010217 [Zalerion maritima]|uniref:C2H2-type domain-containing protein n=1 Tax=Zalerion maritima TaxID=339359 RepID=A0AAD5RGB1_9PEZI|nr:hypothetical protein MKZ38_010217 [Zalerion maritima]
MDQHQNMASDHLAEARRHIMALRNSTGMTEEEVLKWVSGALEPQQTASLSPQQQQQPPPPPPPTSQPPPPPPPPPQAQQQPQQQPITPISPISPQGPNPAQYFRSHNPRLSISSTNSASTGKQSIFSANSRASFDSVATRYDFQQQQLPPPPPPSHGQQPPATPIQQQNQPRTQPPPPGTPEKTYTCTSCDTGFKRKFDWKRHEEEFHERFKKYPCPDCNRILWGSNSFNQHHKVAHGCKTCPHADAVVKYTKKRTAWGCGFCAAFLPTRERYFDHVAQHFDKEKKTKAEWLHSNVIYGLLHQRVIHDIWKQQKAQREKEQPDRTEKFSWDPAKTGRAQGFMEGECPGQLQDLLEFFSGAKEESKNICRIAYEQADILYLSRSPPPSPTATKFEPASPASNNTGNTNGHISSLPPQVVITPAHWSTPAAPQVNPTPGFTVSGPSAPDPRQYRYSVLDRALPPVPQDTMMTIPPPSNAQPQPQPQPQQTQQAPEPVSFAAELDGSPIMFDTPMTDWQSFATTMVEDPMAIRSQPMMQFGQPQYYTNPGVWNQNMQ